MHGKGTDTHKNTWTYIENTRLNRPSGPIWWKHVFILDIVQKGGVQPESKSFEEVLFSPSCTFFWTLNGGRGEGDDQVPKVLRHFLPKYLVNIWILGLYKSYLTVVQDGPTQKLPHGCPKWGGKGGQGPFWTMFKRKTFFVSCNCGYFNVWLKQSFSWGNFFHLRMDNLI